jgi:hypothetical protein
MAGETASMLIGNCRYYLRIWGSGVRIFSKDASAGDCRQAHSGSECFGDPGPCHAGVVDKHIDATSARQYLLHGPLDRSVAADIELDDLDAMLAQYSVCLRFFACGSRIEANTEWPARAKVSAVSRPKPVLAPVIRIGLGMIGFLLGGCVQG